MGKDGMKSIPSVHLFRFGGFRTISGQDFYRRQRTGYFQIRPEARPTLTRLC